ncbi:hypothetical protein AB0M20_31680, partial [Actinoplanes sp. NPDC051633]
MSRQELADAVNAYLWDRFRSTATVDATYIGHLEQGRYRWPSAQRREALRDVLGANTDAQLGFYIVRGQRKSSPGETRPEDGALGALTATDDASLRGKAGWPVTSGEWRFASAVHSFRAADRQVGGGYLYAAVVTYLRDQVGPRLFNLEPSGDGRAVFTAAASLTEMAGWMAHDAGRDEAAARHFTRSLNLVKVGGDWQLTAH